MNPAQRKGRTAEAVRDLLLAHGRRRPLVLVVEDLHWIGPHSEEILRVLLDGVAADPLMVVLTYRPGYAQAFGEQTYFTRITLRALPEGQMQSLVERVASLGRNARPALGELRAVELIYEKSRTPELAYMFKHALTHDVAYETLLRGKRRELHRRTGEVIEELYPDRLPEFYETLAFHLTRGEAWDKAVDDLLKSAAKARAGFDYSAGSRFCSEAIAILRKMVPAPVELGRALEMLDDLESLQGRMEPANEAYEEAMALLEDAAARHVLGNKLLRERAVVRDGATIVYYEHGLGETTLILCHPVTAGLAVFQPLLERFCQDFRVVIWAPRGTGKDPLPGPLHRRLRGRSPGRGRGRQRAAGGGDRQLAGGNHRHPLRDPLPAPRREARAGRPHAGGPCLVGRSPRGRPPGHDIRQPAEGRAGGGRLEGGHACVRHAGQRRRGRNPEADRGRHGGLDPDPKPSRRNFFSLDDPGRDVRPLLPEIHVPTLVLHGEMDRLNPVEMARRTAAQIQGAQFHVLGGRSHMMMMMATTEFADLVRGRSDREERHLVSIPRTSIDGDHEG